jgi:hypothetical protein
MASPKLEVFFLFNQTTGAPKTGQAGIAFSCYKNSNGVDLTPPAITEIGGGAYGFIPTLPEDKSLGVVYVVSTGSGVMPMYFTRYIRPEDYTTDDIPLIKAVSVGKWQVFTEGDDANRLVLYDLDGTTVIARFDLKDDTGEPSATKPFSRTPVA